MMENSFVPARVINNTIALFTQSFALDLLTIYALTIDCLEDATPEILQAKFVELSRIKRCENK